MPQETVSATLMPIGEVISMTEITSGYLFLISGGAVSWRSKKKTCIVLSTVEAEYVALSSVAQKAMWIKVLTAVLENCPQKAVTILEDN